MEGIDKKNISKEDKKNYKNLERILQAKKNKKNESIIFCLTQYKR